MTHSASSDNQSTKVFEATFYTPGAKGYTDYPFTP
ncbi:hypothetical protein CMASS_02875 [Corynebacterium massiliense DSM 45435]|uniref:Uncharacterized protein n=1 Tax=Corynebacterium massiliense DSM 45435 TaxID=1121364 RepID=A0ABY7U5R7_9CORY|nr:hypothetical protein CMASS_02875 [Corynebacterium massiliense DSM 45435]